MRRNRLLGLILIFIILIVVSMSIGYAAFGTTLSIDGIVAESRVNTDVRVTNFIVLSSTDGGISSGEDYNVNNVSANVTLPNNTSTVTYQVEVKNFGNTLVGITDIELPDQLKNVLDINITGYNLNDELRDNNDECVTSANGCMLDIKRTFNITVGYKNSYNTSDRTVFDDFVLGFTFKKMYQVTLHDFTGMSFSDNELRAFDGETYSLNVNASNVAFKVYMNGASTNYSYADGVLSVSNVSGSLDITMIDLTGAHIQVSNPKVSLKVGTTNYDNYMKPSSNATLVDGNGNQISGYSVNYSYSNTVNPYKPGIYTVNYSATVEIVQFSAQATLVIYGPPSIDFDDCGWTLVNANLNECAVGFEKVTGTTGDPWMVIPFSEDNYFDPLDYRYIVIRYKTATSSSNRVDVFMTSTPVDNTYTVTGNMTTNNQWHELAIDLWSNNNVKNMGLVKGLRFDFINAANVPVTLDYIKFTNDYTVLDYGYIRDFPDTSIYSKLTFTNANYIVADNQLTVYGLNSDPQVQISMDPDEYFDARRYHFMYVYYRYAGNATSKIQTYLTYSPVDNTYFLDYATTGGNQWRLATIDLTNNTNIYLKGIIDGFRFDPMTIQGVNFEVSYIAFSDRCRS